MLEYGDYSWLYIKAGVHDFSLALPLGAWRKQILNIQPEIRGGQITYLQFRSTLVGAQIDATFEEIGKRQAIPAMSRNWYRKPDPGWDTAR
ncbi:hypothetical protein AMEJIAPC_01831 [Caulobacter sp. NIBR1757]|nr:hypothetical protein AMEJIAPC_01831 [Caulobacter sp. NIBR1757]